MNPMCRGLCAALLITTLSACGVTAPRSNPGFANLDSLGMADVDRVLALSFGPGLLGFAARHMDDDPETRALLETLQGVRVRVYEIDGDAQRVAGRVNRMSERLQEQGWMPLALLKDEGETVHMLLKENGDQVAGLTVLVADQEDAVLVNIMGELRPELFSDTMAALDVGAVPTVELAGGTATAPGG
jgi:hypothetical protein